MAHGVRSEVEDALLSGEKVDDSLGGGDEAEHAAVAEPLGGGHGCDVGGLVFVFGGYGDEDAAPVEDCW